MSSVADTEAPRAVYVSKGQLEYQTSASSQWLPLQSYENDREPQSTIHEITLREKIISFVQQTCGGAMSCGVRLNPMHYGSRIRIGMVESGQSQQFDVMVELTREELCFTSCLRSANAGTKPKHTVQQCPLAQVCKSFTAMRLYLPRDNFEPKLKKSSGPNEFWVRIVNALRRDLKSVPQPTADVTSVKQGSINLSSTQQGSQPPSVPKANTTSVEKRLNNLLSSQKKSTPPKKTSTSVRQVAPNSEPQRTQVQKASTQQSKVQAPSTIAKSVQKPSVQKPPTTPQRQPGPPNSKQTSSPASKSVQKPLTTPQKQPVPPNPKQTLSFVQPVPPKSKQASSIVQPPPPKLKQASAFVQPTPPKSKRTSSPSVKSVQKPPTTPQGQPLPPNPKSTSTFVQPAPPKLKQTSEFAQSQNSLIPKTVNQKPLAKPTPINPHPRKIIDYKDLDSVVAVPSGSTDLDCGDPAASSQKGSAKKPERPKWEASIMQLQKLEEAADLEGDKAMAEKARKMIKIFEADAASAGKETKAQVDNFKTMWTLM